MAFTQTIDNHHVNLEGFLDDEGRPVLGAKDDHDYVLWSLNPRQLRDYIANLTQLANEAVCTEVGR